ncbi:ATP-binding cassette domain-containing protein [Periweissella ghanensis]|uniref:Vitamin B12 import ATP-binding protein BtuD n=1 Tax=Periweissella ghanensis TaxID=467997 RepID=A0ABM8Z9P9_9LACO|nr:ABC transporter ATP-binding protein [Periweissella ghanensis]MCM0600476.1 ABC transporter ATP-binding protein [Periweissella ghanensis]CAH0418058.1 Vitamin B12 import ATP-binding protein BtuD [Periweissella ghanensis]
MPLCISTASTQIIVAVINQLIVRFYQVDSQSMLAYDGAYLNSRVNEDVSVTARFIYITVPNFIANLVTIGGVGIFLAAFNIKILGLFTLFIVLYMLVFFFTRYYIYVTALDVKEISANYFADRNSMFTRYLAIKAKELLGAEQRKNQQLATTMFTAMHGNFKWHYILSTSKISLSMLFQIAFFIIGGIAVINGNWQIGTFTIILQYFVILINVVDNLFYVGSEYQDYQASQTRLQELLALPREVTGKTTLAKVTTITITDLNINLEPDQPLYTHALNFGLTAGNIYTLTGKNGVGKTTFLYTLLGLNPDYQGRITFDNHELATLNTRILRQNNVAVMLQNEVATELTVQAYLDQFKILAMQTANPLIKAVFFNEHFMLTKLLDTPLNQLSGGEHQLVTLYATLFKADATVLVLDEPFSNISFKLVPAVLNLLNSPDFSDKIILLVSHDQMVIDLTIPIAIGG